MQVTFNKIICQMHKYTINEFVSGLLVYPIRGRQEARGVFCQPVWRQSLFVQFRLVPLVVQKLHPSPWKSLSNSHVMQMWRFLKSSERILHPAGHLHIKYSSVRMLNNLECTKGLLRTQRREALWLSWSPEDKQTVVLWADVSSVFL